MDWQRPVQSRLEQREDLEVREKGVSTLKSEPPAEPVVCSRPIRARFRRLSLKTR